MELVEAVILMGRGIRPGIVGLVYSSIRVRATILPFVALASAIRTVRMELGVVGSRVSTIAASAVAVLALAAFALVAFAAFPLSLAFWRGRVEGATGLEVVPVLVVERAPNLFGRVASGSAAVGAVRGNVANFTAGIAGLVSRRPTRARTSARRQVNMWASVVPSVVQAAESVEVDSPVAASALARFRAFFAFRFSALVRSGAKFASVVRAAAATEPFVDWKCAFLRRAISSSITAF